METLTKEHVLTILEEVKDPEIPVLSLPDLGIITHIEILKNWVRVEITPTFVGCPALDFMKNEIIEKLKSSGIENVEVNISFKESWSSDRISEKGRIALEKFGLAPPLPVKIIEDINIFQHIPCPRCGSTNTELKNPFGSTLCRSIHHCNQCKETFEYFKPI